MLPAYIVLAVGVGVSAFMLWSLVMMISRARRTIARRRVKWSGASLVVLFVAFMALVNRHEGQMALALGFEGLNDYRSAAAAGHSDPISWRAEKERAAEKARSDKAYEDLVAAHRVQLEKQTADRLAEEADRLAEEAEATAVVEAKEREINDLAEEKKREAQAARDDVLAAAAKAKKDADCRSDIQCWGEKASLAASYDCPAGIERRAKHIAEWTDGILEPKFSRFRWADRERGIVTVIGDKVRFQNGFGAWTNMVYECDVDPAADPEATVSDIRVSEGRL